MKGINLYIKIFQFAVIALGALLAVLNYYNSWSEHVDSQAWRPVLNTMLVMIAFVFFFVSIKAVENKKVLTKVFKIPVRLNFALKLTGIFFIGILVCELNNKTILLDFKITEKFKVIITYHVLHYVFTALAIVSGYLTMLFYCDTKKERIWSYIGLGFGAIGFGLGFSLNLYSVSYAEILVSIPKLFFVSYLMNKV